ncbi:uncharacterized protein LOC142609139 [Castanea sativa]|uniref:uncharacterized protein LOC142609139 n=1 Tax=Castanea sativa TaxID=21020 RepID=UPI003F65445B
MPQFSKPTFSLLLIIISIISIPTVQSEYDSSTIRLPSKDTAADLCANSNNGLVLEPASYPVKCFWANLAYGVDGVTYWCGCVDALCASVKAPSWGSVRLVMVVLALSSARLSFSFISFGIVLGFSWCMVGGDELEKLQPWRFRRRAQFKREGSKGLEGF